MDTLARHNEKKPVFSTGLIAGIVIGVIAVGVFVGILLMRPSMDDQKAAVLADAIRPGEPQFEQLSNDIVITNGDTVESPNAFGNISMYIVGTVKNKGSQTVTGLEVNVAVVDQKNQVVRDKSVLVVPTQRLSQIEPGETIPITLEIAGFDRKDDRANIRWTVTAVRLATSQS